MTQRVHSNPTAKVDILPSLGVPYVCAFTFRDHDRRPRVDGQDEASGTVELCADSGRKRRGILGVGDGGVGGGRDFWDRLRRLRGGYGEWKMSMERF